MSCEIDYLTVWVSHIPLVLQSIFVDDVMIDCRDLEWCLHILLNDTLQELLQDIQVTNKLLLDMLGLLVVLASCIF
jgi:hypothetical protein